MQCDEWINIIPIDWQNQAGKISYRGETDYRGFKEIAETLLSNEVNVIELRKQNF